MKEAPLIVVMALLLKLKEGETQYGSGRLVIAAVCFLLSCEGLLAVPSLKTKLM